MKNIKSKRVQPLIADPLSYAMLMNDRDLENVIVAFVSVLLERPPNDRGGQN